MSILERYRQWRRENRVLDAYADACMCAEDAALVGDWQRMISWQKRANELEAKYQKMCGSEERNDDSAPEKVVSGGAVDATTEKRSKTEHDGVTKTPDLLHDSQDKLYEDANSLCVELWNSDALSGWNTANMLKRRIIALLDRQRAITERECRESETFRAGIVRDAAANGETVYVFGVPYVPASAYYRTCHERDEFREKLSRAYDYAHEILRTNSD